MCFQNSELISLADESRGLKDELDVLRHTAEQVVKYEAQIESYKKKMGRICSLVDDLLHFSHQSLLLITFANRLEPDQAQCFAGHGFV